MSDTPTLRVDAFVKTVLQTGSAFAVRSDNSESIFIPKSVAQAEGVQRMDQIEALVIPSLKRKPDNAPWFCIEAAIVDDDDESWGVGV